MSDGTAERWHPRTLSVVPADAKSLEEVAEKARQKGYADGLAQGQAEAKKQGEQTANELAALWTSMQRPIAHQDSEVSEYLLSLVIAISKLVVRRELTTDEYLITTVLNESLELLAGVESPITITLNPSDKALVETLLGEKRLTAELIADAAVLRGGCLVERGHAVVDATIDTQIRTLIEQIVSGDGGSPVGESNAAPLDADRINAIAQRFSGSSDNE